MCVTGDILEMGMEANWGRPIRGDMGRNKRGVNQLETSNVRIV